MASDTVAIKISQYEKEENKGKKFITPWLAFTAFITCLGSSLLPGYNIGVLNSPTKIIVSFYNETYAARNGDNGYSEEYLDLLWTITVAIFVFVAMIGAFTTGIVADRIGRKKGLLFNHIFMFIGVLLEGLSKWCKAPELLIIGRGFVGYNCGLTFGLASLFLTEISPTQVRGAVGSCHQLAVTIGILLAQVLGLTEILGTESGWPWLMVISGVPAVISCILLPFCPESPRFLLINKGDEKAAVEALQKLRGSADISREVEEMQREAKESSPDGTKFSAVQLFTQPELRMPLIIALVMQVAQQWSGINCIFFFSEAIFTVAGVARASIPYAIVATGVINVVTTCASVQLIEKLGRRSLLLFPMCLMALSNVVITVALNLQDRYKWMSYVSIACVILFIIGFALGLGSVAQLLCNELFRQEPRPTAMAIAQGVNWTSNFVLTMAFKFMQNSMGSFTFLFFLLILVSCIIFIFFMVPETKNRTFDEISRDLMAGPGGSMKTSRSSTAFLLHRSRSQTPSNGLTPSPTTELMTNPMELVVNGGVHQRKRTETIGEEDEEVLVDAKAVFEI